MFDLRILSTQNLARLYNRVWERATRGDGYQPFGYDWSTMCAVHPGYADILLACKLEALRRLHA